MSISSYKELAIAFMRGVLLPIAIMLGSAAMAAQANRTAATLVDHSLEAGCLAGKVVETAEGNHCAYIAIAGRVDATRHGVSLFEVPTYVLMKSTDLAGAMDLDPILASVLQVATASYEVERRMPVWALRLDVPKDTGYVRARQSVFAESARGSVGRWTQVNEEGATLNWLLKKLDPGKGRSWLHADVIVLARHPAAEPDRKTENQALREARSVVKAKRAEDRKAIAEQRKQEAAARLAAKKEAAAQAKAKKA